MQPPQLYHHFNHTTTSSPQPYHYLHYTANSTILPPYLSSLSTTHLLSPERFIQTFSILSINKMNKIHSLIHLLRIPPIEDSIMSNLDVKDYESLIQIGSWKKPNSSHQEKHLLPVIGCNSLFYPPPHDPFYFLNRGNNIYLPCTTTARTIQQFNTFLPCQGSIEIDYDNIFPKLSGELPLYQSMRSLLWNPINTHNSLIQPFIHLIPCQKEVRVCISCNNESRQDHQSELIMRGVHNQGIRAQIGIFCVEHSQDFIPANYEHHCHCMTLLNGPQTYCVKHWYDRGMQTTGANKAFVDYLQKRDGKVLEDCCPMDGCMRACAFIDPEIPTETMALCLFCFTVYILR